MTNVMSSTSKTSYRQKTLLLNVHPRNVSKDVKCRKLMTSFGDFLWSLSMRKSRTNVLCPMTKAIVL
jgi:hypothetical protein